MNLKFILLVVLSFDFVINFRFVFLVRSLQMLIQAIQHLQATK